MRWSSSGGVTLLLVVISVPVLSDAVEHLFSSEGSSIVSRATKPMLSSQLVTTSPMRYEDSGTWFLPEEISGFTSDPVLVLTVAKNPVDWSTSLTGISHQLSWSTSRAMWLAYAASHDSDFDWSYENNKMERPQTTVEVINAKITEAPGEKSFAPKTIQNQGKMPRTVAINGYCCAKLPAR